MGKKKKIYKTDLGEFNIPTKWEDITLEQLSELERYYEEHQSNVSIIELLSIFTRRSVDEIEQLPIEVTERLLQTMSFINEPLEEKTATNKIVVNGETYVVHTERQLKTGEAIAAEQVMSQDKYDYASLLAIVCRKEGELYDSHFENEVLPERVEMWKRVPAVEVKPLIAFFLRLWYLRNAPMKAFLECEERLDQLAEDIENSAKDGTVSRRFMRRQMKTLKSLKKSINAILQTSSN